MDIFAKIINKEIPAHFIYEDDVCVAILDKFPNTKGQCLVIPRSDVGYLFDIDDQTYKHIFFVAKKIARVLDIVIQPKRTCLVVEGFEVNHVHIKLFPVVLDRLVTDAGPEASDEELSALADQIKKEM